MWVIPIVCKTDNTWNCNYCDSDNACTQSGYLQSLKKSIQFSPDRDQITQQALCNHAGNINGRLGMTSLRAKQIICISASQSEAGSNTPAININHQPRAAGARVCLSRCETHSIEQIGNWEQTSNNSSPRARLCAKTRLFPAKTTQTQSGSWVASVCKCKLHRYGAAIKLKSRRNKSRLGWEILNFHDNINKTQNINTAERRTASRSSGQEISSAVCDLGS